MDVERGTYYGFIEADDYCLYEKVRLQKRNWGKGNYEESITLLKELEEELDLSKTLNLQFVETTRFSVSRRGKIASEQEIEELKKILRYTMKNFEDEVYRVPFRQEVVILNMIALSYKRSGKREDAISIYEQIYKRYKNSQVLNVHHAVSEFLLYTNYVAVLEENDELVKAEQIGKEGIELMLECQRGDIAGTVLGNLACVYEKQEERKELAENCLRNSYYLLALYKYEKDKEILQEAYKKLYTLKLT